MHLGPAAVCRFFDAPKEKVVIAVQQSKDDDNEIQGYGKR